MKIQVHIVFRDAREYSYQKYSEYSYSGNEFIGVFFDRESAEAFIAERPNPSEFFIETYDKPEAGKKHEVFC